MALSGQSCAIVLLKLNPQTNLRRPLSRLLPFILLFWLAFALRAWQLTAVPPGLTHDEANHGREAIGVLDGELFYFFPLNYGSEPLYSYTVAATMAAVGENLFALRLVNVVFGVFTVALTYAWAVRLLDRRVALLAAVLLAVSFWPLASSREALRAGMLPFFMLAAVWFFWRIIDRRPTTADSRQRMSNQRRPAVSGQRSAVAFALSIATTFHIYLAARVTWLLFPLFLLYLALWHRERFRRSWRPILAGLLLAGLLAVPLVLYLRAHPEMQPRLSMLDRPLEQLRAGEWRPLLENAGEAILAFFWPGYGDQFLAYNIPGRPVLDGVTAVFFLFGLLACLWRWRQPIYAFLLLWWGVGIVPSLVTGPTANTTRNLAALPVVYLIAAVGFMAVSSVVARFAKPGLRVSKPRHNWQPIWLVLAAMWLVWVSGVSARDYFVRWGQSAEVRGAYQHTLVEALAYLEARDFSDVPFVFSSVYPGPAHDSSIAAVLAAESDYIQGARWVDARYGLVIPEGGSGYVLVPASTPLHPALLALLQPVDSVTLRPDDLDPGFTVYRLLPDAAEALLNGPGQLPQTTDFGAAVRLRYAEWLTPDVRPGGTAELLTAWGVLDPMQVGPLVPPAFATDAVLFTHVLDGNGEILTQRDSLDAPSWAWWPGDVVVQIHQLLVPENTAPGEYQAAVGIYDRMSEVRLAITNPLDIVGETTAVVPSLTILSR